MKLKNKILCAALVCCVLLGGCNANSVKDESTEDNSASETAEQNENTAADNNSSDEAAINAKPETDNEAQQTDTNVQIGTAEGNVSEVILKNGDLIAEFDIEGYGVIKAKLYPENAPVGVDNFVKLANNGYYDGLNIHRVVSDFMIQGGSLNGDGTGGNAADGKNFGIEVTQNMRHFYGALCYANSMGENSTQFYIVNNKTPQDLSELDMAAIKQTADMYRQYRDSFPADDIYYKYYNSMVTYYTNLCSMLENATDDVIAKYNEAGGTPFLDGGYTVFGQVYEGFDVIDSISACEVKANEHDEVSLPIQTITINSVKISEYSE